LLLALGAGPALAAAINVAGACTLLRAIIAANNDVAFTGCVAGSGADTIRLSANTTQILTIVNNNSPYSALPGCRLSAALSLLLATEG
jgi:hypothetical protein